MGKEQGGVGSGETSEQVGQVGLGWEGCGVKGPEAKVGSTPTSWGAKVGEGDNEGRQAGGVGV